MPNTPTIILPNEQNQVSLHQSPPASAPNFGQVLYGNTQISAADKNAIQQAAQGLKGLTGAQYNAGVQNLNKLIYGSGMDQATKDQLAGFNQAQAIAKKSPGAGGGGTVGAGRGGGGGNAGGGGGGSAAASNAWANDVLKGNFNTNPWLNAMMNPANLDVRNNPNLQPVVDAIQRNAGIDLLRNLWTSDQQAEGQGRAGSGYSAALQSMNRQQTNQAVADAISNVYAGAYENEANRQAGLMPTILGTQANAAQIPIGFKNAAANMLGASAAMKQAGVAGRAESFNEKMQTANAQQDAVDSYLNILRGIGGLGGTTTQTTPGQYVPTGMNPWQSAGTTLLGDYLGSKGA